MRNLTVDASSLEVAQRLFSKLSAFHAEIIGGEEEGYQVRVSLRGGDATVIGILNALEEYVEERKSAARVELDGRSYTVQPSTEAIPPL